VYQFSVKNNSSKLNQNGESIENGSAYELLYGKNIQYIHPSLSNTQAWTIMNEPI
jgi:hypothetical protein